MSDDYYNVDGDPITLGVWTVLFGLDEYKRVERTDGDGWSVATAWVGLNHSFDPDGPPLIFETNAFFGDSKNAADRERYPRLAEAQAGHVRMVKRIRSGQIPF